MSLEKMNSKIESFVPSADPNKIAECHYELNEVLENGTAKDLQIVCVKYGSLLGYKCLNYMLESLYHGVTPSWVGGSVVDKAELRKETKPWWG